MSEHSARIKTDIVRMQIVAEERRGDDPSFDVRIASLITTHTNNLQRIEKMEESFVTPEQVNEQLVRPIVERFARASSRTDLPDCYFRPIVSDDAKQQIATLESLRGQLEAACCADEPSTRYRLTPLLRSIYRAEKRLIETMLKDGAYFDAEACNTFGDTISAKITDWGKSVEEEQWVQVVDKVIGKHDELL